MFESQGQNKAAQAVIEYYSTSCYYNYYNLKKAVFYN